MAKKIKGESGVVKSVESDPALDMLEEERGKAIMRHTEAREMLGEEYEFEDQKVKIKSDWREAQMHAEAAMYKALHIGKRLRVVQSMEGPHWREKIADVCNFSGIGERQTYQFMQLHREFGDARSLPSLMDAGSNKLLEVLRMPEDIQDEVKETGLLDGEELSRLSVRELRAKVKEYKDKLQRSEDLIDQGSDQLRELEAENAELRTGRRMQNDASRLDAIAKLENDFAEIDTEILLMNFDGCSDQVCVKMVGLLEKMRARIILLMAELDEKSTIYERIGMPVLPAEIVPAERLEQIAKSILRGTME